MPDGATITPEAPQAPAVKKLDVLAAGGEMTRSFGITPLESAARAEIREAEARNKKKEDLKKAEGNSPEDIRGALGKTAEVPEYTQSDLSETTRAIGAPATLETTLKPIAQYLEAVKISQRNGTDLDKELDKISDIRKNIGILLVNRGGLFEKFPELKDAYGGDEATAAKYIEKNLGRDSRFQKAIAKELTEIHEAAMELEAADDSEEKRLHDQSDTLGKLQESLIGQVKKTLGDRGLNPTQQQQVEDLVKAGNDADTIIQMMKIELKLDPVFDTYNDLQNSYQLHNQEFIGYSAQLAAEQAQLNKDGNYKRPGEIARLQALITQASTRRGAATRSMDSTREAYKLGNPTITSDAEFEQARQKHNLTSSMLSETGPLKKTLETAVANQTKVNEIEKQLKQIENDPKNAERTKEKQKLLKRLEGAVDTAVANALTQRYNDMIDENNIFLKASEKKAKKDGKVWKADGISEIKKLSESLGKFNPDTRKFEYDKKNIAEVTQELAALSADGSDGTRKMFAEKVGFKLDPQELKDAIASQISTNRTYDELTPEQKLEADSIVQQRTADFESIMEEHGEKFNKRVFETYFAARGFMDKIGKGSLSLTDDEMKILNKQFGKQMESELQKSGVMDALKERGIKPNEKMKITLFLLALLGILTVGGFAAAGIGGAAAIKNVV